MLKNTDGPNKFRVYLNFFKGFVTVLHIQFIGSHGRESKSDMYFKLSIFYMDQSLC